MRENDWIAGLKQQIQEDPLMMIKRGLAIGFSLNRKNVESLFQMAWEAGKTTLWSQLENSFGGDLVDRTQRSKRSQSKKAAHH